MQKQGGGKSLVPHHLRLVVTDCVVIQGEKPPLPTLPLKHTPHYRLGTRAVFFDSGSDWMCYKTLVTHHISLFNTETTSLHTRPVALPLSALRLLVVILKHFMKTHFGYHFSSHGRWNRRCRYLRRAYELCVFLPLWAFSLLAGFVSAFSTLPEWGCAPPHRQ